MTPDRPSGSARSGIRVGVGPSITIAMGTVIGVCAFVLTVLNIQSQGRVMNLGITFSRCCLGPN